MAGPRSSSCRNFLKVFVCLSTLLTVSHCFTLDLKNSSFHVQPNTDVTFVCEAKDIRFTDRVRWLKKVDVNVYPIVDGTIQYPFKTTQRYNVRNDVNSRGQFKDISSHLKIIAVQPEDAGTIGCQVNNQQVFGSLAVFGPIKYVKMVRTTISGQSYPLTKGQYVMFGDTDGLECEVKGVGTSPKVKVQIGDMDVTRSYNMQEVPMKKNNAGLVTHSVLVTLSTSVLRLSPSDNGQQLRCIASAPNYLDMETYVTIGMKAEPVIKCKEAMEASVGQEMVSIVCHVLSNPTADRVIWFWTQPDNTVINLRGNQTLGSYTSSATMKDFNYTVTLTIHDVGMEAFRDYCLRVTNEEGEDTATVTLSSKPTTTTRSTTTTTLSSSTTTMSSSTTKQQQPVVVEEIIPAQNNTSSKSSAVLDVHSTSTIPIPREQNEAGAGTKSPVGSSTRIVGSTGWSFLFVLCSLFPFTGVL